MDIASTPTNPIVGFEHLLKNPDKFELLISDYRMPYLNGCEFGAKVKELNRNIKVILISAYDSIEDNLTLNFIENLLHYKNYLIL